MQSPVAGPRPATLTSPREASSELAIEVRDLRKSYGDQEALKGISFEVPWGRVCGYLGPNGAGKSTTIKTLAGILRPSSGSVRIAGHDLASEALEAKAAIGYVPESGALYGLLSTREHLQLVAGLHGLPESDVESRIARTLEAFDLEGLADRRIDTLSKGQRQRALLATAVLHDPDVLLLDEPLNGLDVAGARQLKELIEAWAAQGKAVVYCSHVLDVVERICDDVIIVAEGRIALHAPTKELLARSKDATLEAIFHSLVSDGELAGLLDGESDS